MSDLDDHEVLEVMQPIPQVDEDGTPALRVDATPVRGKPGYFSIGAGTTPVPAVLIAGSREQLTFLGYVKAGAHPEVACELAGVKEKTFAGWLRIGELHVGWVESGGEGVDPATTTGGMPSDAMIDLCSHLVLEMRKALPQAEVALLAVWRKAAIKGDWRAARDFLARRFPERWREQKEQIQSGTRLTLNVTQEKATPPDLGKILAALHEAGVTESDFAIEATSREMPQQALPAPPRELGT